MVDNLKVAGVNKMNNDWIFLPKVYLKKTLPVEKEEVATPEKVSKWKIQLSQKLHKHMILKLEC